MITLRESKRLSQSELAEQMQFGRSMVNRVESRERPASADYVIAFALAMEIGIEETLLAAGLIPKEAIDNERFKGLTDVKAALQIGWLFDQFQDPIERGKTLNIVQSVIKTAVLNSNAALDKAEIETDRKEIMAIYDQASEEDQETLLWAVRAQMTKVKGGKDSEAKNTQSRLRSKPAKAG